MIQLSWDPGGLYVLHKLAAYNKKHSLIFWLRLFSWPSDHGIWSIATIVNLDNVYVEILNAVT